jgi:phage regulator Rha-like protein
MQETSSIKLGASVPKRKAAGGCKTTTATHETAHDLTDTKTARVHDQLTLTTTKTEARVDTRLLAKHLGNKHKAVFQLLTKHKADFQRLGKVPFEMEALPSGQHEKYGVLNEDQSFLMLTFSSNTAKVRDLKVKMVQAFGEARKARELRQTDYLPTYHALHDEIHVRAGGSPNERFVHMNVNKLLNNLAGIGPGQRAKVSLPTQSLLVVAQLMAAQAMRAAPDHREGYKLVKAAVEPLLALTADTVLKVTT